MGNLKQRLIKPGRDFNYAEGVKVKNASGAEIAADKIVRPSGVDGPYLEVSLADDDTARATHGRLLVTKHAIPNNGYGIALPWKLVTGSIDMSTSSVGAPVFVGDDGAPVLTPGTNTRRIGTVVSAANPGAYLFGGEGVSQPTYFGSTEQTGTGSEQSIAHGLGTTPSLVWITLTEFSASDDVDITEGTHDGTNIKFNVTNTVKYRVYAIL